LLVPVFLLSMFLNCWRCARTHDIIFANWSICGIIAGIVGRLRGKPIVVTLRGEDANRVHKSRIFRFAITLCGTLCSRVVTVSEAMAMGLRRSIPHLSHKILTIPNGVAHEFLEVAEPKEREEIL